ncbi:hypothetical protein hairong_149 [Pseudomonas phage hairong]|nr:hypothetical protein hairong_149 [Pseudomonas phage hairong]
MTRFQDICQKLKRENISRWIKESMQPITTSIEDMQAEAKIRAKTRQEREDPEDEMFASMRKRRDQEIERERRRYKTQAIRKLANQLLVDKSKAIDPRCERLSHRDGQEALEQAQRIYELTENFKLPEAQTQE